LYGFFAVVFTPFDTQFFNPESQGVRMNIEEFGGTAWSVYFPQSILQ
jgi:hypothetical protein